MQTNAPRPTLLQFISGYQGQLDYLVIGGPQNGRRVTLTIADLDYLDRQWDPKRWNMSRAQYEREYMARAGALTCGLDAVGDDVMDAYRSKCLASLAEAEVHARKHAVESMDSTYFAKQRAVVEATRTSCYHDGMWVTKPVQQSRPLREEAIA